MCDYSLHHVATRPAKVGDKLTTTTFHNTNSRGFAAVGEPGVAVCLMPGSELAFDREVEMPSACFFGIGTSTKKIGQRVARFRQINMDTPRVHHDALEFANGQTVLLTSLCEGQPATVLQMPIDAVHVNTETGKRTRTLPEETQIGEVESGSEDSLVTTGPIKGDTPTVRELVEANR